GHELILGASLGISLFSEQAREISVLMSQANLAMQHAKQLGGNTFQFFRDNLQDSTLDRLAQPGFQAQAFEGAVLQ
ncbi:hypothetical protein ACV34I_29785, partial [Pseudomonas aeruginosa]